MASIVSFDESKAFEYSDDTDDVKSIRRECDTVEQWQSQLLRSLQHGGWKCGMLLYLPAPLPLHWALLLQHEYSFQLVDEMSVKATIAYDICGHDRRLWMALACQSLTARGWTPTMLSQAWKIPKTNIYRYLETELTPLES